MQFDSDTGYSTDFIDAAFARHAFATERLNDPSLSEWARSEWWRIREGADWDIAVSTYQETRGPRT